MTAKDLVGPLARIWFVGGASVAYGPPRDTGDIRYAACREHRPACDCREAMFAEDRSELSHELRAIKEAISGALAGHPTFAPWDMDDFEQDIAAESGPVCRCTGCVIVRALYRAHVQTRSPLDQDRETRAGAM